MQNPNEMLSNYCGENEGSIGESNFELTSSNTCTREFQTDKTNKKN